MSPRRASKIGVRVALNRSLASFSLEAISDNSDTFAQEINERINARLAFIAAKNWAEADRIRDELLAQGIQLKDGKDPATGERITTWEVKR